jgi:hypothetical protein
MARLRRAFIPLTFERHANRQHPGLCGDVAHGGRHPLEWCGFEDHPSMSTTWRRYLADKPRLLAALLRLEGAIEMLAFLAVVMPTAWMAAIHRWLGLGEFPAARLLDYMIRSVSLLYGMHGVLVWILASDVRRFRPIIIYAAVTYLLGGLAFLGIDLTAGMPGWWTVGEAGSVIWLGLLLVWLLRDDGGREPT